MRRIISRPLAIELDKKTGLVTISQAVDFEEDSLIELPREQVPVLRKALQQIEEAEGIPSAIEANLGGEFFRCTPRCAIAMMRNESLGFEILGCPSLWADQECSGCAACADLTEEDFLGI